MKPAFFDAQYGLAKMFWLANLFFALAMAVTLWVSFEQHLRYAEERAANTSLTLERSVSGMLDQIEALLDSTLDDVEGLPSGRRSVTEINTKLVRVAHLVPGVARVAFSDAAGMVAPNIGYPAGAQAITIADRDYFLALRAQTGPALMVGGAPVIGRSSGKQVMVFGRAYRDPAGGFGGVVFVSVELARFVDLFAALKLGERAEIALVSDRSFLLLAGHPMPADLSLLGRPLRQPKIIEQFSNSTAPLSLVVTSKQDGLERLYSARRLEARPYWIGVGLSRADELAAWRQQVGLGVLIMFVFAALTAAAGRQLQQGWRRQQETLATLQSTLDASKEGILVVDTAGRVLHSNRRYGEMWRVSQDLLDDADHAARLDLVAEQLVDPSAFVSKALALYRDPAASSLDILAFKDGRVFERQALPMLLNEKPSGRVWNFRDISEAKRIDDMLHFLAQRGWVGTGLEFLPALAQRLGELLKVDYVIIDKLADEPGTAETVGLYAHGGVQPNLKYSLAGTPCDNVIGKQMCIYKESVQQLFPEDGMLVEMKAESYLGMPLWDAAGRAIGLIAVLDGRPLQAIEQARALLGLVASAAAAELERQREQALLLHREAELAGYREGLEELVRLRTQELALAKDRAEASNRAKSVFLANMSHELRTPLNAILGFAQLLLFEADLPQQSRDRLATINRSGQHLLTLINDVLEISRIEAGRSSSERRPFDLHEVLVSVEEMVAARAAAKGLAFSAEHELELAAFVLGDGPHLKQVLINLLGNAVKYTEQGFVSLRASRRNGEIAFEVADSGAGISPSDQERIFQPFYQTEAGAAKGEGTGLGLAISREYAALMGGRLEVHSTPGQGSLFTLSVPLPPSAGQAPRPALQGVVLGLQPGLAVPRLLVVDDQADNRELTRQLLAGAGLEVRTAVDGREAVAAFQNWRPDLIWMDMRMPVMDGYEATRQIRALPGGAEVKIVALTASAFEEDRSDILAAGCDELLRKPLDVHSLFEVMGRLLNLDYRYAETPGNIASAALDLHTLPGALRGALRAAALALDVDAINGLLATLALEQPALAGALRELAQAYRFDRIAELCERI